MITPLLAPATTNTNQNQQSDSASILSDSHSADTTSPKQPNVTTTPDPSTKQQSFYSWSDAARPPSTYTTNRQSESNSNRSVHSTCSPSTTAWTRWRINAWTATAFKTNFNRPHHPTSQEISECTEESRKQKIEWRIRWCSIISRIRWQPGSCRWRIVSETPTVYQSMYNTLIFTSILLVLSMQYPTQNVRQQQINFATPARRQEQNQKLPQNSWGDFLGPKSPARLCCYLQNPNRISARDSFVDFRYLCQMLMTHEVDIFALPGSGLDWKQHTPRNKCRQIIDDFWQHTRLVTSTSNVLCDSFTQFGVTCTGITHQTPGQRRLNHYVNVVLSTPLTRVSQILLRLSHLKWIKQTIYEYSQSTW